MAYTQDEINTIFQRVLQRDATPQERADFAAFSVTFGNAETVKQIVNSAETNLEVDPIIRLYQAAFGRIPDQAGLNVNVDVLAHNPGSIHAGPVDIISISKAFVVSQEFGNLYHGGALITDPNAPITEALLQAFYQNVLGRQGSAAEVADWMDNNASIAEVLVGFSQSEEYKNTVEPDIEAFLTAAANGTQDYAGELQDEAPEGGGLAFVLTAGVDVATTSAASNGGVSSTFRFTAGDETVTGEAGTLQTGDTLRDGSTADSDQLIITMDGDVAAPEIVNIEQISIEVEGSSSFDGSNVSNVQNVSILQVGGIFEFDASSFIEDVDISVDYAGQLISHTIVTLGNGSDELTLGDGGNAWVTYESPQGSTAESMDVIRNFTASTGDPNETDYFDFAPFLGTYNEVKYLGYTTGGIAGVNDALQTGAGNKNLNVVHDPENNRIYVDMDNDGIFDADDMVIEVHLIGATGFGQENFHIPF